MGRPGPGRCRGGSLPWFSACTDPAQRCGVADPHPYSPPPPTQSTATAVTAQRSRNAC